MSNFNPLQIDTPPQPDNDILRERDALRIKVERLEIAIDTMAERLKWANEYRKICKRAFDDEREKLIAERDKWMKMAERNAAAVKILEAELAMKVAKENP